jgi:methylglutaconyl-CoA hydratase
MTTINIQYTDQVATVWLNRPSVHNALNGEMIHELFTFFSEVACNKEIRVVVIRGKGDSFCSGADLNWMKEVSKYNYDQNFLESKTLARCLFTIQSCPKPVVSVVHGACMGGANGIVSASDIVIAANSTRFRFSEVSLGLVPAVISPYVTEKIGKSQAQRLFLLAEEFKAADAQQYGLVHYVMDEQEIEDKIQEIIKKVIKNSPEAIQSTKLLMQELDRLTDSDSVINYTSEVIAKARISDDGQEGMAAFFEKRKPEWALKSEKI